jgi:hypothetical protein
VNHKICIIENNDGNKEKIKNVRLNWIFHIFERLQVVHAYFSRIDNSFKSILLYSELTPSKLIDHLLSLKSISRLICAVTLEVSKLNVVQFDSVVAQFAL